MRLPVVEQRAPASQRVETLLSRLRVRHRGRKAQQQGEVRRGGRRRLGAGGLLAGGWARSAVSKPPPEGSRNFRNTSPQRRKCPHSRAGTVGAGCQNSLYGNGIRRTRAAPGRGPGRRRRHADLDQLADLATLVDERAPRLAETLAALAALRHRITELELRRRRPGRPPRPRRRSRRRRHRQPLGQHRPGRPNATPNAASPWPHALDRDHEPVRDAMAAGTRLRGAGRGDRQGCRRAAGRAPPQGRSPPDRLATEHDPVALRRLAHHVLEVVAPEIAEDARAARPCNGRKRWRRRRAGSRIADDGHGLCHGRFTLPVPGRGDAQAGGARLRTPPSTASTPAPPRGSGTRSASTSPATRSTGSPRPAASTPPWWSR